MLKKNQHHVIVNYVRRTYKLTKGVNNEKKETRKERSSI